MPDRFVVTGSGRCGTQYMSRLLTAAGVNCGHQAVWAYERTYAWGRWQADSSWMAACHLPLAVPVVLLVRHPLPVARSWSRTWLAGEASSPLYRPLRNIAGPELWQWEQPHDRGLALWLATNRAALGHAEVVLRLETLDGVRLERLLRWAGHDPAAAMAAFATTPPTDRYADRRLADLYPLSWEMHDKRLADEARELAALFGYDPEAVPDA